MPRSTASPSRATTGSAHVVAGVLTAMGHAPLPGSVSVLRRTPRQRAWRAVDGLVRCWALALAAVFVPVLHFVLVPALLLAGPLVARSRWRETATVLAVLGSCPGCHEPLDLNLRQPFAASLAFRCERCGRALTLQLDPALAENAASLPPPETPR